MSPPNPASISYISGVFLFTNSIIAGSGDKDKTMEAEETSSNPHKTPKLLRQIRH